MGGLIEKPPFLVSSSIHKTASKFLYESEIVWLSAITTK